MKNADYFSNYVTEDFTTYINRKRKNNCHGNHIEMQAMAEMYNRPVEVYQYGTGMPGLLSQVPAHYPCLALTRDTIQFFIFSYQGRLLLRVFFQGQEKDL